MRDTAQLLGYTAPQRLRYDLSTVRRVHLNFEAHVFQRR